MIIDNRRKLEKRIDNAKALAKGIRLTDRYVPSEPQTIVGKKLKALMNKWDAE